MKKINIAFLLLIVFLSACGGSESKVDSALAEQILYFGNGTEPKDLDPHTVTGVPESHILMALLEGLVMRHPEGLDHYLLLLKVGLYLRMEKPISLI